MIFFFLEESVPKLSQMNKISANELLIQIPMKWGNMTLFFPSYKVMNTRTFPNKLAYEN